MGSFYETEISVHARGYLFEKLVIPNSVDEDALSSAAE
jgi:hypothetical protein